MSTDVEPGDWTCLDPWWAAYVQRRSVARTPRSARVVDIEQLADCWDMLNPWWEEYTEIGYETAISIAELLEQSNEAWQRSDAPFDTDPLAADLTGIRSVRGPLHPDNEVEWSRWLAQLLRPSAALVSELFDVEVDLPPKEIVREDHLSRGEDTIRRPDILVFHAECGVSIEVKLGDENYRKTPETAKLVEEEYGEWDWVHTLLLPKLKAPRLDSIVSPSIEHRGYEYPQIEWNEPGPIDVVYWQDVTAAIRSLLRRGAVVDDHWAANAYLFCAVAEQRIMNYQPQSEVKRLAEPANVVDANRPAGLADALGEQLTYLRTEVDP